MGLEMMVILFWDHSTLWKWLFCQCFEATCSLHLPDRRENRAGKWLVLHNVTQWKMFALTSFQGPRVPLGSRIATSLPSFSIYHASYSRSTYFLAVKMEAVGSSGKLETESEIESEAPIPRITINITLILLGEEYELRRCPFCNEPQSFITSPSSHRNKLFLITIIN
jgi:hypothetical protein